MGNGDRNHTAITGGAGGLGLAIARRCIARGAAVVLRDRDPAVREAATRIGAASGLVVDFTDDASVADATSMGRLGRPDEVAEMVAWLASPACSFSTGAAFDLSGGRVTY